MKVKDEERENSRPAQWQVLLKVKDGFFPSTVSLFTWRFVFKSRPNKIIDFENCSSRAFTEYPCQVAQQSRLERNSPKNCFASFQCCLSFSLTQSFPEPWIPNLPYAATHYSLVGDFYGIPPPVLEAIIRRALKRWNYCHWSMGQSEKRNRVDGLWFLSDGKHEKIRPSSHVHSSLESFETNSWELSFHKLVAHVIDFFFLMS